MITQEKIPCSIIKLFSQLILNEMYGDQFGRICMWILGLKGLKRFDCIERLTVEAPIDYTLIFLCKQR